MCLVKKASVVPEYFDAGEGNDFKLVDVISKAQNAPFDFGVVEMNKCKGVEFEYDDDGAVCYMLDGEITLEENLSGEVRKYEPGDVVYIPKKEGLVVTWSTDKYAKFIYVTYPHWR